MPNRNRIKMKLPFACKSTTVNSSNSWCIFFLFIYRASVCECVLCFVPYIMCAYCSLTAQVQNKLIHFFSLLVFYLFFFALFHCMVADWLSPSTAAVVAFSYECISQPYRKNHQFTYGFLALYLFAYVCCYDSVDIRAAFIRYVHTIESLQNSLHQRHI